ncbi:hypothetical protein B0H13DRAFT_1207524 [Mycena leptocephala]|nr:hypothetical protein B0H13DRAFT_1207524 [Mycena leptocephala]
MADSQSNPPLVKHHTVIRDHQGNFSCDCSKFRTTGKTCSDIVAARYYAAYGPPADYLKSEQGPENHGPAAKGQKKVPPRNSTGKKGRKTNLPTDGTVDDIHDLFLEQLEQEKDWNPFSAQERPPPINDSRETIPPRTKASAGRPAAAKPLHSGRSGASSPVKFSSKPGPKGHGYNSILPPLPPPPAKSPTKIPPGLDMKTDPSVEKPMQELHKLFLVAPPISHQMQEELDIIDIDFKRWRVPTYRKREDEVLEVVEMSNALCLSINNGTLVYGPSYASDADVLRNIVWSSSDEEPILADGSVTSLYGRQRLEKSMVTQSKNDSSSTSCFSP